MCGYTSFVNKRTGKIVKPGIGGESGERVVGTDPLSRLVIVEGPELDDYNEIGYAAFFYELNGQELKLIGKAPIPRDLEES